MHELELLDDSNADVPNHSESKPAKSTSSGGLEPLELAATVIALGTSVAAAVTQQVLLSAIATIPLSAAVGLNLLSRRRLAALLSQNHDQAIAALMESQAVQQSKLAGLMLNLTETQDQVLDIQGQVSELNRGTRDLHDYTRILDTEQKQIEEVLGCLREIEKSTQVIQSDPSHAKAYYNRGLTHQRLGDAEASVVDYTEAIRVNDSYAKAFHNRGVARSTIGDRKGAVEDLRVAAKLFFDQGDIGSYQRARDLAKRIHELGGGDANQKEVPLELLFS
ncbi:hypothetical protein L3556_04675 [Candidatus Synechococcus calcipolaris G9]|uniref:Tetratricopeptide repeat protein n=1 Tax=Candidatus Synechococcus calcipolaris G9 TaxID=1497997 RepID=A0ABT6EXY0_9SYNE|nr:hypothetical protein [Candidatus Synechococcus calcipolaris]MDG2990232.1 hypothetical protein [Candidatus Synechococcus calcipolaris G9]